MTTVEPLLSEGVGDDATAQLLNDAWRGINDCGMEVGAVIKDMTDIPAADHLRVALERLGEAHDALAQLGGAMWMFEEDGDPFWHMRFVIIARVLADLDDAEIIKSVRSAAGQLTES